MDVISTTHEMSAWTAARRMSGASVGFVPTMGALHDGHLSLVRASQATQDATAVSIFVNPAQFDDPDDYALYPRTFEEDLALCERAGVDAVFAPSPAQIWQPGATTRVDPGPIGDVLEGAHRPGHFAGVATVVVKLLHIVDPDSAYFGAKDYQQVAVIRRVVGDLDMGHRIVACPTIREHDGLAMSSRNARLGSDARRIAAVLHRSLTAAALLHRGGCRDRRTLEDAARDTLAAEPGVDIDYVALRSPDTLDEFVDGSDHAVMLVAARVDGVRLIDNLVLSEWTGD